MKLKSQISKFESNPIGIKIMHIISAQKHILEKVHSTRQKMLNFICSCMRLSVYSSKKVHILRIISFYVGNNFFKN